jgi:hypothetical protein
VTSRRVAALGVALAVATVVLAACGCSTGAPSSAARPSSTASPSTAAPAVPIPTDAGGAAGSAAGSTNTDRACTIVSRDDVAKAAGFSIATVSGAGGTCIFQNAEPSRLVAVRLFGSQADMASLVQMEGGGEHVANLGDDAFWFAVGGFLFVRKGDHGIQISDPDLIMSTNTTGRDALVALARTAVPSL